MTVSAQAYEIGDVTSSLTQNELDDSDNYTIEQVADELFGDVSVEKSEYLYNLDDSADYIYLEFENGGYAVFLKQTMELLEYSPQGKLDYPETTSAKYYAGPSFYLVKAGNSFINTFSQECYSVTNEEAQNFSNKVRERLLVNYESRNNQQKIDFDYSILNDDKTYDASSEVNINEKLTNGGAPSLDRDALIRLTDGVYIPNYRYFLLDPKHGQNSTDKCGAVAAQLLLSYHNYYSDRRIIANSYLNGGNLNPESNPNLCNDPMLMTSDTLGTRGYYEDGHDDTNSYFHYIVENIPGHATTTQVKNGIDNVLSERAAEIDETIEYTITSNYKSVMGYADPMGIFAEIGKGNPVILLMQESMGGLNHYVVAYGCNNYTYPGSTDSYFGYITHFGWKTKANGTNYLNIWVNASWCSSYISLNIEHTHNYYEDGAISGTSRTEYKCSTCGHRTDAAINMAANDRYVERIATIPQNGYTYKDYYVTFSTSGNKLLQTFGSKDTAIELFDDEYTLLASDDDSGYLSNALINYSATANKPYIVRVRYYNASTTGDTKLSISPIAYDSDQYSDYDDIINYSNSGITHMYAATKNTVEIITFSPEAHDTYDLATRYYGATRVDTCVYLIDPNSTSTYYFNDDGGGNLQALLSVELYAARPYYIIISAYNITTITDEVLYLDIDPA